MKRNNNPYVYMFRHMRFYAASKKMLFLILSMSTIARLLWLLEPWIFGQLINIIQLEGAAGRPKIKLYLGGFFLIYLVAWMFHGRSRIREEEMKFQVAENYVTSMFHKVASLPMQRHTDNHSGETIDKVNKGMYAIREFSGDQFMYVNTIIFAVGSIVSLSLIWRPAAVILILFSCVIFFIVWKYDEVIVPLIKAKNKKEHVVMSALFDLLSNIKTIITLRCEHKARETVQHKIHNVFPVFKSYSLWNERKWFTMDMLMQGVIMIILGRYIWSTWQTGATILIGTLMMIYQYIHKMSDAFDNFTWQWSGIVTKKADMEATQDIEQAYDSIAKYEGVKLATWSDIHLHNLYFSYEDSNHEQHILENISLHLQPGKKIALVGESGSGKSTILSLLRGLYDVDAVQVSIDGVGFDSLRVLAQAASLIPQEPEIFEQSIRHNVTMGLEFSDKVIRDVLAIACMDDVIREFPEGLDTDIKEKGVNLSGGQKQRLALARGLLLAKESDILLLDEPTSSVDSVNEVRIHGNIFNAYPDHCILSSIHKLHLLELFDEIVVLDEGRVVESGTLAELKKKGGMLVKMLDEYVV